MYIYLKKFNPFDYIIAWLRYIKIKKYIPHHVTILDLGCAYNAPLLYSISSKITRGFGIDLNVNTKKSTDHIMLIRWDLNQATFPILPPIDVVTCLALAEHLKNPQQLLNGIYHLLKPAGLLILTVPNWKAKPILEFLAFKLKLIAAESIKQHKRYFSKEEIVTMCRNVGFNNITHTYFQFGLNNLILAKK